MGLIQIIKKITERNRVTKLTSVLSGDPVILLDGCAQGFAISGRRIYPWKE